MSSTPFKVVILGEGRVGKTSLLRRYVSNTFDAREPSTQNAAYLEKQVVIRGHQVNLSLWDTAGQERFSSLAPIYYRDADAALLVYDITDLQSFERVAKWVRELKQFGSSNGKQCILAIVGNKADLRGQAAVNQADAESYATSISARHSVASAKSGQGVDDSFLRLAEDCLDVRLRSSRKSTQQRQSNVNLIIDNNSFSPNDSSSNSRKKKGCC
mmetsp:Transcript_32744/g.52247  ORF Transcript_32744/g.52247 Transcript_32744/m.52247 type:complete len:214 (+) Transcript_32744:46-687(+)